ncbi:MAG: hypothetical protein L0Y71_17025 [Gemmataceae bacterium]|nr:hypothetical protein [Gemmataceae bacterium]
MRVASVISLCFLVFSSSVAQEKKDYREVWAYAGGWFSTEDGKTWMELSFNIYHDNRGRPIQFKEVKRTKEYVEIYDASRKLSVRLFEAKTEWKKDGKDEWSPLLTGQWRKLGGIMKIERLDPSSVKVGWEGKLTIHGKNFGEAGYVSIESIPPKNDVVFPKIESWTADKIIVYVTKAVTDKAGIKRLVVHNKAGDFAKTFWSVKK